MEETVISVKEMSHKPFGSGAKKHFHWDRELLEFPRCDIAVIMG